MNSSSLQSLVQLFFTDRLQKQLSASPYTIGAYRDTFRLLLRFASERLRRVPSQLRMEDLDASFWESSSNISNSSAATVLGPGTTAWRLCTHSSNT